MNGMYYFLDFVLTCICIRICGNASRRGREFQKKYTRSPYNLYISIVVSTLSVIGLLIPNFPVQVVCIIFIHGAMELFLTLIAELQGAITTLHYFTVIGPTA